MQYSHMFQDGSSVIRDDDLAVSGLNLQRTQMLVNLVICRVSRRHLTGTHHLVHSLGTQRRPYGIGNSYLQHII